MPVGVKDRLRRIVRLARVGAGRPATGRPATGRPAGVRPATVATVRRCGAAVLCAAAAAAAGLAGGAAGVPVGREAAVVQEVGPRLRVGVAAAAPQAAAGGGEAAGGAQHPPEPHRHPDRQAVENPIEATAASRAIGRQRYVFMCRECHGNSGKGDGDMSHAGGVPSDFTDAVWQHGGSDGEIFAVIKEGVTADMQGYANRLSDEEIWHLVNYLKSFAP